MRAWLRRLLWPIVRRVFIHEIIDFSVTIAKKVLVAEDDERRLTEITGRHKRIH